MDIEIVDNFLSSYHSDILIQTLDGKLEGQGRFPWFFNNDLNGVERMGNYYFTSSLIHDNNVLDFNWISFFNPLLSKLKLTVSDVNRLKLNLYPGTQRMVHHASHMDYRPNSGLRTCLYYVNTNNGFTIFDGKRKIRSKKNRAILFDGSNKHHSTTPTDCNYRCSVNIDYKV